MLVNKTYTEKINELSKRGTPFIFIIDYAAKNPLVYPLDEILDKVGANQLVLGICLGHEAIALHNGGQVKQLDRVFHGDVAHVKASKSDDPIYRGMPSEFEAGLYHSWIIDEDTLPDNIGIGSRSELGLIMGLQHKELPQFGFQFHPESYRTQNGLLLLKNWYNLI